MRVGSARFYCSYECKALSWRVKRQCLVCSTPIDPSARFQRVCPSCVPAHQREQRRRERDVYNPQRKAAIKGLKAQRVDIRMVLERDGWRCKACGVDTPKALRGAHGPNAPELDHIVPMSRGGAHEASNMQCLCRSCNQRKSAMTMEEFIALAA